MHDSPVSLGGERFSFDSKPNFVQHHVSDNQVVVPDAHLLFSGDYMRIGSDLIISGNGQKFVIGNYFKGEARPVLTTKDGATLSGHIVDALTGHVHYAQATAPAQAGEVIGHVLKMSGSASVIRNGVSVELNIGDPVQKGDVVQTGSNSSVGMTFVDGSAFGMSANARMVLNEMIFDPNGSSNSSLISLVQGTITFVAGQTAKNGNMRVETPVATMGIRGTAVLVEIGANDGPTKFSVLVEPDGHTGSYNLYDKTTGQLIGTVSQAGQVTYVSVSGVGQPPTAIEQLKTLADQESAKTLIQEVFKLYFPNYNPDNANPKSQKNGFGSPGDNLNPFAFYKPLQDLGPPKVITIPGVGYDPVTGQPNPPRTFYNTKAQFSALPVFADQAFDPTIRVFFFKDVVQIDDPDVGNAPFYDVGVPFVAGSAIIKSAVSTIPYLTEGFLKPLIHINQTTGVVSFDREQFNFLDDGQTVTFKIQVTATSGPDTGLVEIPITITGANDAPTIVVGAVTTITGMVKEDVQVASSHIETNGTITFKDVDLTDAHTATAELTSTSSTLPGFVSGVGNAPTTTKIGTFTIDPVSESTTDTNNQGSVGWHFSLDDNDPTLQSLAEGQTITQIYTITIKDDNGVPVTQTVTITITGTNDDPLITASTNDHPALTEDGTLSASGVITFKDVDLTDGHLVTQALTSGSISSTLPGFDPAHDQLGTLTLTKSESTTDTDNTGTVSWSFAANNALLQQLAVGQVVTQTYTVTIDDQHGGTPATQTIVVTLTGTNDDPLITASTNDHPALTEDGTLSASGVITFKDVDLTDGHLVTQALTSGSISSTLPGFDPAHDQFGTLTLTKSESTTDTDNTGTVSWSFAANNALLQQLAVGQVVTQTYTVTIDDQHGGTPATQTIVVTLTGTNDDPLITASTNDHPALTEDGTLSASGVITFKDVDLTDGHLVTQALTSGSISSTLPGFDPAHDQFGTLTLTKSESTTDTDNTGTVSWSFAANNALLQQLAVGQVVTQTYTVTIDDQHGGTPATQTIVVTLTGTNDDPVLNGDNVSTLELGGGVTKVTGIALSDVDAGADTFTVTATADHGTVATATGSQPLAGAGVSGSFADISNIFNDGAVYTPDNASPTDKVTLTVTDGQGGSDTLNFVFKQYAPGGVTLTGTTGKDIIFSSTGDDTMTGLTGKDNFVFAQVSGHDTIMDFTSGTDKIDFRALSGMNANALTTLLATADHTGGDTLLHINGTTDTLLLKGVAALNASDFILHA
ncbi:VCBS domain-containing protein [Afipia sp. DC4300-2b1]|uniref:VCBS domain-containing protein n=1 Tax=Afipia sp. DC4300-2b1 TaxID=2804672 RepID=UPI003CF96042